MICPYCNGNTGIFKTRPMPNSTVLRERRCAAKGCRAQFVTIEQMKITLGKRISVRRAKGRRTKS
jgi:transcriptional regulator NrdR family protein